MELFFVLDSLTSISFIVISSIDTSPRCPLSEYFLEGLAGMKELEEEDAELVPEGKDIKFDSKEEFEIKGVNLEGLKEATLADRRALEGESAYEENIIELLLLLLLVRLLLLSKEEEGFVRD